MMPAQPRPALLDRDALSRWAIMLVLVALYAAAVAVSSAFLDPTYLGNIVRQAAPVGIAAIGTTLVMIVGCVDLSIGAIISLTAVLCAVLMVGCGSRPVHCAGASSGS